MDYLPIPEGVIDHVPIPVLDGIPYDNKGFRGFDSRSGWNLELLLAGDIPESKDDCVDGNGGKSITIT